MQPLHNPISQVVYAGHGAHVQHSWVAGRQLLNNGKLQTLDESKIIRSAQAWRAKIASNANPTTSAKELA
jgi:5-methylthioadenosine/S-adenosylhomocysteine deaminase